MLIITAKYTLFALIATGINLLTQWLFFRAFQGWWVLYLALAAGTLTGLITKYVLDKKWIFSYRASSAKDDLSKFGLYSLMGLITTGIFWGTEMSFYYLFNFAGAQYIGGGLGLAVGYLTKYHLDKEFVFKVRP